MVNEFEYIDDFLEHHGIKGQKWGVRRFQNEDGTYTSAGKERRNAENKSSKLDDAKEFVSDHKKQIATAAAVTAAIAGGTAYYLTHKDQVDRLIRNGIKDYRGGYSDAKEFVKKFNKPLNPNSSDRTARKAGIKVGNGTTVDIDKKNAYYQANRDKIMKDPDLFLKYADVMSREDIAIGANMISNINKVKKAQQEDIRLGATYINSILAYGSAATAGYALYNSPLGKDVRRALNPDKEDKKKEDKK